MNNRKAFTLFEKLNLIVSSQKMSLREHIYLIKLTVPSIYSKYKLRDLVLHTLRYLFIISYKLNLIVNLFESKSYWIAKVQML